MTAIEQTAHFFQSRNLNLAKELEHYIKFGHAHFSPDGVLMAREMKLDRGINDWITDGTGDCWYVFWACGKGMMDWFVKQAPKPKQYVAWHRWTDIDRQMMPTLRVFPWERVSSLALKPSNNWH